MKRRIAVETVQLPCSPVPEPLGDPASWKAVRLSYVDEDNQDVLFKSGALYLPFDLSTELLERVINDAISTVAVRRPRMNMNLVEDDADLMDEPPDINWKGAERL